MIKSNSALKKQRAREEAKAVNEITARQVAAMLRAVKFAGSKTALARGINMSVSSVNNWSVGLNGVTEDNAKKIESYTGGEVKAIELSEQLRLKDIQDKKDALYLYR